MIFERNFSYCSTKRVSTLKETLKLMDSEKLRFVMCLDETGRLWGVLTPGDINRWLIAESSHSLNVEVGDICNQNPIVAYESSESAEIRQKLEKVAYLPLVDRENRPVALAMRRYLQKGIKLGDRILKEDGGCYIIAEIGNNHNGSLKLAKHLIDKAKESGADCAKFQMRDLQTLYANSGNANDEKENLGSQYTLDLLQKNQLSTDDLFEAFEHCKKIGIEPLCTPWDLASIEKLEEYGLSAFKVASADLTNHELLRKLAETGKPLICSTGMSQESEIRQTVALLRKYGVAYILLHCNSTYPAPFKDIHLAYLERLKKIGDCLIGYSGHERDIFVPIAAATLGAKVIEKHFTIDRNLEGNDHKISLLPDEFARMVEGINQVSSAMGMGKERELSQGEMMNRVTLAKSVYAKCDLKQGEVIQEEMLEIKSPGNGLQPNQLMKLVGKSISRTMKAGDVFYPSDLLGSGSIKPKQYNFHTPWGIAVRHHDYNELLAMSNPSLLEFHLSYKDLDLDHGSFFSSGISKNLIVHAPELFAGDHVLDLTTNDKAYRERSIAEMKKVIAVTKILKQYFSNNKEKIGIITNVGGFSINGPLNTNEREEKRKTLLESIEQLTDDGIEIWPQTMPPFPWHFGGQRYHNLFIEADEIIEMCKEASMKVCLDVSHSKLACNYYKYSFQQFLEKVLPHTAHIHVADASGVDGEGLQIGEGEIDFYALGENIKKYAPNASWIPEIWQGHENKGEGFWKALSLLENMGL